MAPVNLLDVIILALVGVAVFTGFRRGAAFQLIAFTGLILGLIGGALLAPEVAELARDPLAQATLALLTLLVLAAVGNALGWLLGRRVWAVARRSRLDPIDAGAGSVVAAAAALLIAWFLAFNLVQGPFPSLSSQIRESAIIRGLDAILPRPPSLLAQARTFFDRFGFPEVFAELPPAPVGPVEGPSRGEVGRALDAADQSTVRIVGEACGRIQEGSGFVVNASHVVTNAHVVAGVTAPEVQAQGGNSLAASTVLFDPDLDVAVLRVEGGISEPLDLLLDTLGRGEIGAVLGYPGGGDLTGGPAAVRRTLVALGRDIYGEDAVRREVYELQSAVRPGNSGGPFVTPAGEVAGVVFAASTANHGVGYAILSQDVMPRVEQAAGRGGQVSTGPCLP